MLTSNEILKQMEKGNIGITPFNRDNLNPNSYNVTLNNKLKMYNPDAILDPQEDNNDYTEIIIPEEGIILKPNRLYIGATNEIISTDKFISAIDGRSSIGRLGIMVHLTAGFGDIGFKGTYTLEIVVTQRVRMYPNYKIAQVYFSEPYGDIDFLYSGRYQNQIEPTTSRASIDSHTISGYHYDGGK